MDRNVRDNRDLDRLDDNERDGGWLWPAVILALVLIGVLVFATSDDQSYTRARMGSEGAQDVDQSGTAASPGTTQGDINQDLSTNPGNVQDRPTTSGGQGAPAGQP